MFHIQPVKYTMLWKLKIKALPFSLVKYCTVSFQNFAFYLGQHSLWSPTKKMGLPWIIIWCTGVDDAGYKKILK